MAEGMCDALSAVDEHIDGECDIRRSGDRPHGVVDRVPLEDRECRAGIGDPGGAVELEHRVQPGQPGRDHLRTAAEPREEVRLHEPRRDADVRVDPLPVQPDGYSVDHPDEAQIRGLARVVIDDAPSLEDIVPEHLAPLPMGAAAMRAGRDQHDHVLRPHEPVEHIRDGGQHRLSWLRSRRITDRDRHTRPTRDAFPQGPTGHRTLERRSNGADRILGWRAVCRCHDGRRPRHVDRQAVRPERKSHGASAADHPQSTTRQGFLSVPMASISTSTTSPSPR
jgi:hypothetical protein